MPLDGDDPPSPGLSSRTVHRASLIRKVERTPRGGTALIIAAAGAGKSVLVRQWAAEVGPDHVVWVNVNSRHDDAVLFVRSLVDAGDAIVPGLLTDLIDLVPVGGSRLGSILVDTIVERFSELDRDIVLVVEDLHRLSSQGLVSDLGGLALALPPQVRLIVTSRWDPPWVLTPMRMDGRLVELRGQDLAFDVPHGQEMLNTVSGQSLSTDQVARLVDRTDGWAAGLQLAGISLQDTDDLDRVIDTVTGTDRSIGEYLLEEVVDQQDPTVCRFLLHTAILEWFTPELCEAVSGESSARTMIEELERRSLFLVRLDGEERYRYHHLFADLLRYRLRRDEPAQVRELHRTAARWLLDHGHTMDAVDHLLDAGDHGEAFGVISSEGHQWFERGESATLVRWLATIVDQDPTAVAAVSINLLAAQVAADDSAAAAETHRHLMRRRDLTLGESLAAAALHSLLVFRELSPEECIKSAGFVRDNLPLADAEEVIDFLGLGGRDSVEVMGIYGEAWAHFVLGDLTSSTELLRAGLSRPGCDYPMWRVYLLGALSLVRAWGGHSSEASSLATGAIGIAERFGAFHHEAVTSSRLALALVHLNRLELDEAAAHLSFAADQNRYRRSSFVFIDLHRALAARVIALTDGPRRALALLREPSACVVESPLVAGANSAFQVHLRLQAGEIESAAAIIDTSSWCPGLAAAQVDIALSVGDRDSARRSLERWSPEQEDLQAHVARLLRWTIVLDAEGERDLSRAAIGEAIALAETEQLRWPFLEAPAAVDMARQGPWSNGTLLKPLLSGQRLSLDARRDAQAHLVEPLTARELEILACLPGRARNHEVATSLYISANTLKSHLRSIYRKLDVADRDEAVRRATELGLL